MKEWIQFFPIYFVTMRGVYNIQITQLWVDTHNTFHTELTVCLRTVTKGQKQGLVVQRNALTSLIHFAVVQQNGLGM